MQTARRKTKIVATIGPVSWDEPILRAMIRAGMDVVRINFSHGEHARHAQIIQDVRRIAAEENRVVAILCDLQGPKIRIGALKEPLILHRDDVVILTLDDADGTNNIISLPHPEFVPEIPVGARLLLDDGNLEFVVQATDGHTLCCDVLRGGTLFSRKGVMAPDARLTFSAITEKDRTDIAFAMTQDIDYLALSFVRDAADIHQLRDIVQGYGGDVALVAKIEKHEALADTQAIINACDAVMVARGDLGLEIPPEEVPYHQKRIIKLCNDSAKPVITATQMLNSMVDSPRPTRAEASDVYNAIMDGTDAVMLSNESAAGQYPLESLQTMATIAMFADQDVSKHHARQRTLGSDVHAEASQETISNAISEAVYHVSELLNLRAIFTMTLTGYTARLVARERPHTPILCVTPRETTYRRMALVWGVSPLLVPEFGTIDSMIDGITCAALKESIVDVGDTVVIVMGVPFYTGGKTNMLKIHQVEAGSPNG